MWRSSEDDRKKSASGTPQRRTSTAENEGVCSTFRHALKRALTSICHEAIMGLLVVCHLVLIVQETDYLVDNSAADLPLWMTFLNIGLVSIYLMETLLRLVVWHCEFFRSGLNVIDLLVLILDILNIVAQSEWPFLSILRVLRVARVLRTLRAMSVFPELRMLIRGIGCAVRALLWGCVLLLAVFTMFSVVAVQIIHPLNKAIADSGGYDSCSFCGHAFESVFQANLTFLLAFFAMGGWTQVSMPLFEAHRWTIAYFAIVYVVVSTIVLNLILCVVLGKTAELRAADVKDMERREERHTRNMRTNLFSLCGKLDTDGSGKLTLDELEEHFDSNQEFKDTVQCLSVDEKEDLRPIFEMLDVCMTGAVGYEEFVEHLYLTKCTDVKDVMMHVKGMCAEMRAKVREQNDMIRKVAVARGLDEMQKSAGFLQRIRGIGSSSQTPRTDRSSGAWSSRDADFDRTLQQMRQDVVEELAAVVNRLDSTLVELLNNPTRSKNIKNDGVHGLGNRGKAVTWHTKEVTEEAFGSDEISPTDWQATWEDDVSVEQIRRHSNGYGTGRRDSYPQDFGGPCLWCIAPTPAVVDRM